jgi:hypothetical protein
MSQVIFIVWASIAAFQVIFVDPLLTLLDTRFQKGKHDKTVKLKLHLQTDGLGYSSGEKAFPYILGFHYYIYCG